MLTIHVWPRRLKEFLLTHPLYKSPQAQRSILSAICVLELSAFRGATANFACQKSKSVSPTLS